LDRRFESRDRRWRRFRLSSRWRAGAIVGVLVVVVVSIVLVGGARPPVFYVKEPPFALPGSGSGCHGVRPAAGGGYVVPITVRRADGTAVMFAEVCVNGQGPFPFVIDTGAQTTVIVARVAHTLHLARVGSPVRYDGVGCTLSTAMERVSRWSVAGLPMAGQTVAVQSSPGLGGKGQPDGLLGANTLSRFGAVLFDFSAQTMTFPGPEGPAPRSRRQVTGPLLGHNPSAFAPGAGTGSRTVGLTVVEGSDFAVGVASVHFRGTKGGVFLAVDTGASTSIVDTSVTTVASLTGTDEAERATTVCSVTSYPLVRSGPWSVGDVSLIPLKIGSTDLGSLADSGILGLLGLDELTRYRYVVIDYADAALVLGPLASSPAPGTAN
jgi:Aspartyl protease